MYLFRSGKIVLLIAMLVLLLVACKPNGDQDDAVDQGTTMLSNSESDEVKIIPGSSDPVDSSPRLIAGSDGDDDMEEKVLFDTSSWLSFSNDSYHFSVIHPKYYDAKPVPTEELDAQVLERIDFFDSRSELAELEPPAFSVLIYANPEEQDLTAWLKANGYESDDEWIKEPFEGENFSGIIVLSTNYMSPGEFIFILHEEMIFQLTLASDEAHEMVKSFSFTE